MTTQDLTLSEKVRCNSIAVSVSSFSRILVGVVLARMLGPDLNGRFTYLIWIVESLVLVFSVGLPNSLNRYLALYLGKGEDIAVKEIMRFGINLGVALSCTAAVLTYCLSKHILAPQSESSEIAAILSLLVAAQMLCGLFQSILTGIQSFRTYSRVVVISSLVLLVAQITGVFGWGLNGAMYGLLSAYALSSILILRAVFNTPTWKSCKISHIKKNIRQFFYYSRDAWLAGIISALVWGKSEIWFLDRLSTDDEVGYFAVGLVFSNIAAQLIGMVSSVLLPHISYLVGENKTELLKSEYVRLTTLFALLVFPLSCVGIMLMPEIVQFLFGSAYAAATPAAQWLMATGLLTFATVGSSIVYGHGDAHIIRNWSVVGGILLGLLCFFLAPKTGAAGVAASRFFVQFVVISAGIQVLRKNYGFRFPIRPLALILIAASFSSVVSYVLVKIIGGGVYGLLFSSLCAVFVYLLIVRISHVVSIEDLSIFLDLFEKLPTIIKAPFTKIVYFVCIK